MNELIVTLGWVGIYAPVALGAIGSGMGCALAGSASVGAMLESEGGYGRYVGMSVLPSTLVIYGIVVMFTLNREVTAANGGALFAIGLLSGFAFLYVAVWQGRACAAAIAAAKDKPEIFGISLAPAAIIEGFAVFAFVFALVLAGSIPAAA